MFDIEILVKPWSRTATYKFPSPDIPSGQHTARLFCQEISNFYTIILILQLSSNLCSFCALVRSNLNSTSSPDTVNGTFPYGKARCKICIHTNIGPSINTPETRISISSKFAHTKHHLPHKCHEQRTSKIDKIDECISPRRPSFCTNRPQVTCKFMWSVPAFETRWTDAVSKLNWYFYMIHYTQLGSTLILISLHFF